MKWIFEYLDYRQFMLDFYEDRKKSNGMTWRDFSKMANFSSPSYLMLVCNGKSSLSRVGVPRVAKALGLSSYETEYFEKMVEYGNAKDDAYKKKVFEEMKSIAKEQKARVLDSDLFAYYDSAANSIVRELAPLMPGALPNDVTKKINHAYSAKQVRDSIAFLVKSGLLREMGENIYVQTDKAITGSTDSLALALRSVNRQMIDLARESLDKVDASERNVSGVTMGVDEETYRRISQEVDCCRKKIIAMANHCKNINQVYRLNIQLFPLTEKV